MNGEISGKKIQNMDIMEVRKNKYILDFFKNGFYENQHYSRGCFRICPLL